MNIDLKQLEKVLAEHKVYDAWQYVKSLNETLVYMSMSYNLLNKVYDNRRSVLASTKEELLHTILEDGSVSITSEHLNRTNLEIAGYSIDDSAFLRKTTMEFFHYARISLDILYQIVNAGLFGDKAFLVTDKKLIEKVTSKVDTVQNFSKLKPLLAALKNDEVPKYLRAFNNYIKHIKTVLITTKNSFIIGDLDKFYINSFYYNNIFYEQVDALIKVKDTNDYVIDKVEKIINELLAQVPNCLDNSQRIQEIKFNMQVERNNTGDKIKLVSFYIEVENNLSELPNQIKVYPLIIKPNGEIQSFDFKFDKLFIKKRNASNNEDAIIGYAELKNSLQTNEFYRIFDVKAGSSSEYLKYLIDFSKRNMTISIDFFALEGQIIFYENK